MRLVPALFPVGLTLVASCGKIPNPFPSSAHHDADVAVNSSQSHSGESAADCTATTVHRLTLPYDSADPTGATFAYSYEYHPPTTAGAPTVVYISGGPGQTSIGTSAGWLARLPAGYGLVLTDPRGVGCNANPADKDGAFPQGFYRSDLVADDILAAVADAGLADWLVYGISYGTAVATITASKAEAAGADKAPKAVVLEGTLGRAETVAESDGTYIRLWDAELAKEPSALAAFSAPTLPLGYSVENWQQVIQLGIMLGTIGTAGTSLTAQGASVDFLDLLVGDALSGDATRVAWAKKTIDSIVAAPDLDPSILGTTAFYVYIACQELWSDPTGVTLQGGHLAASPTADFCPTYGLSLGSNAFDAAKWPIKAPIYYLQGADDPATPEVVARYHFDAETTSPGRQMALVTGGGHNAFEYSLNSCYQATWTAMASGTGFSDAVAGCKWPLGVTLVKSTGGTTSETSLGALAASP